jgi:AcrR family transcriptional regulator
VVLQAGLQEFIDARYLDVNMSSVARRARMSTSSVYYHFSSREELWVELHANVTRSLAEAIATPGRSRVLLTRARAILRAFVDWMQEHREYALFYCTYAGGNVTVEAARRKDAVYVTKVIAAALVPTAAQESAECIGVQVWVAAVTLEVLFRELCLTAGVAALDRESLLGTGEEVVSRIVSTIGPGPGKSA